ncbi:uncharacterized protein LOC133630645 [Entelurus aequoreus]|uniref:uncharacterized protein LOC133630645 n=1 Tax=Entelurus aequoreus TaxID=161455 RepID=UPI002B1D8355|nr:uncharacterized protein LOC133630645 [Entelurus aequoreus]
MKKSTGAPLAPVWVAHTPTPEKSNDSSSSASSVPPYLEKDKDDKKGSVKDRLKTLIPLSWGSMVQYRKKEEDGADDSEASSGRIQILPNGTRVSPPVSPLVDRKKWNQTLQDTSTDEVRNRNSMEDSLLTSIHPAEYYAEKLEVYKLKYSYLKSWPGLLRLLAGVELLFGAMVVACVIGYIQKDSEWSNTYGHYNGVYNNGLGLSGYSYSGPMTPFVVSVAGVSWIMTLILLVMGMTMYYRTILLDAPWWPVTEAFVNVALFLLYMAAGIVYVNDLNRGGLCYMTIGIHPILAGLCRVEGGQMAGTAFLFINMAMYLGSFLVCLKMWRHEAKRRQRGYYEVKFVSPKEGPSSNLLAPQKAKHMSIKAEAERRARQSHASPQVQKSPACRNKTVTPACVPEVHIIADYIMKYPEISSPEEREKYKAVFNDQYQEYKELYKDISITLNKFSELDAVMTRLITQGKSQEDRARIQKIVAQYDKKKSDPAFLEKKQRCDYLKAKLSHIKNRIRAYDQETLRLNKTMHEPHHYHSRPLYGPPSSSTTHSFYPPRSVLSPQSQYVRYASKPPAESHYPEDRPQHFHRWFSPPGFVKTFQGATVLMCFLIFALVASTLVWDMSGLGYGVPGSVPGAGQGYYGGSYGYGSSYMTPQSAKAAMISMAAINFLISLGFLVGSFSRSRAMRGCTFYLTVFICDVILAVLQGIIDIIFVIGVNPMSQSSQSVLYNPMLMMCQNIPDRPSLSGSVGAGFPGGFPMYSQYLYHYCFMDPEEAVALALGLMVVLALAFAAYYAYKTRSKIWRHGEANIYWDEPRVGQSGGRNVQDWVNHVGEGRSTQQAPTVVISEKAESYLHGENRLASYRRDTALTRSEGSLNSNIAHAVGQKRQEAEHGHQNSRPAVCSSSSDDAESSRKPPSPPLAQRHNREHERAAPETVESQYETGYTSGGATACELDQDQDLYRRYPEIISDQQRRRYKREFDSARARYKILCQEMDDISDRSHELSRELDSLQKGSVKYQGVADEYNRLKDLQRAPGYQAKKKESKELRQKLFHVKRMVKNFDRGLC